MEPLVSLMQETPPDELIPLLVEKLQAGTSLKTLVAAGALGMPGRWPDRTTLAITRLWR
jgi:hypothetical protein